MVGIQWKAGPDRHSGRTGGSGRDLAESMPLTFETFLLTHGKGAGLGWTPEPQNKAGVHTDHATSLMNRRPRREYTVRQS